MGLQRLIAARPKVTMRSLAGWISPGEWLRMRAVAAGIAEPPLLVDGRLAEEALELHRRIIALVSTALFEPANGGQATSTRSEPFQKLVQCLEYSLSVIVAAVPDPGFAYLCELAASIPPRDPPAGRSTPHTVFTRLLKANLRKNRLKRYFAPKVEEVLALLQ